MSRAALMAMLLSGTLLAGCAETQKGPASDAETLPLVFALDGAESRGSAVLHEGRRLVGETSSIANDRPPFLPAAPPPTCAGDNCERIPLVVHQAHGLEIGLEWEGQDEAWKTEAGLGPYLGSAAVHFDARVLRDGKVVLDVEETFHYGGVGILEVEPGDYEIQVVAAVGAATYLLSVRPHVALNATGDLLPDLVAIPPDHPTFRLPIGHEAGTTGDTASGCGPDESAEDQDLRCLRFAGIIGNQGPGDFLTVLEYSEATASLTGDGHWEQVIHNTDGSQRRQRIGPADYHEVHGHFHILDFVATQLYAYDLETGARGEPVGDGRKMGFCVIDGGIIDLYAPLALPRYQGDGCCYLAGFCQMDMVGNERFRMGISPNWYDIYPWWRSDQYVEVSGLTDGVYELVTVINPDGLIEETDSDNNEASSVLRIVGDVVEVLSMQTQARLGPHPDADWGYAAQQKG